MIKNLRQLLISITLGASVAIIAALLWKPGFEWWTIPVGLVCGTLFCHFFIHARARKTDPMQFIFFPGDHATGDQIPHFRVFEKPFWAWNWWFDWLCIGTGPGNQLRSYKHQSTTVEFPCGQNIFVIVLARIESPDAVLALDRVIEESDGKWKSLESLLEFFVYEFAQHARGQSSYDCAGFHNPRDPDQQNAYLRELRSFLRQFLEKYDPTAHAFITIDRASHFEYQSRPHDWVLANV